MSLSKFAYFHQAALEGNGSVNHAVIRKMTDSRYQHSSICLHSHPTGKVGFVCVTSDERVSKVEDLEMIQMLDEVDGLVPNGTISVFLATDAFKMPPKECKSIEFGLLIPDDLIVEEKNRTLQSVSDRVYAIYCEYEGFELLAGVLAELSTENEDDCLDEEEHRNAIENALKEGNEKNSKVIKERNLRKATATVGLQTPVSDQATPSAAEGNLPPLFHKLPRHSTNPVSFNIQLPANTPFRLDRVIYSTFCTFTYSPQFAVVSPMNYIEFYHYDRVGVPQWKVTDCHECLVVLQRIVRHIGYMMPFIRGDHPGVQTAPATQMLQTDSNCLAPNTPFTGEQVLAHFRNNFLIMRPDGFIGSYNYDLQSGVWSQRLPKYIYDGLVTNVKQRGISNPVLEAEVVAETHYYVQPALAPAEPGPKAQEQFFAQAQAARDSLQAQQHLFVQTQSAAQMHSAAVQAQAHQYVFAQAHALQQAQAAAHAFAQAQSLAQAAQQQPQVRPVPTFVRQPFAYSYARPTYSQVPQQAQANPPASSQPQANPQAQVNPHVQAQAQATAAEVADRAITEAILHQMISTNAREIQIATQKRIEAENAKQQEAEALAKNTAEQMVKLQEEAKQVPAPEHEQVEAQLGDKIESQNAKDTEQEKPEEEDDDYEEEEYEDEEEDEEEDEDEEEEYEDEEDDDEDEEVDVEVEVEEKPEMKRDFAPIEIRDRTAEMLRRITECASSKKPSTSTQDFMRLMEEMSILPIKTHIAVPLKEETKSSTCLPERQSTSQEDSDECDDEEEYEDEEESESEDEEDVKEASEVQEEAEETVPKTFNSSIADRTSEMIRLINNHKVEPLQPTISDLCRTLPNFEGFYANRQGPSTSSRPSTSSATETERSVNRLRDYRRIFDSYRFRSLGLSSESEKSGETSEEKKE